jgi:hypothetical protein
LFSSTGAETRLRTSWSPCCFGWAASNQYHQPLYFDDTPLERYGQTLHPILQPWISGARFFATFPIIPYKIGVDRTHDHIYTLGNYRPGSPTPRVVERLPLEVDATLIQAATWVALIAIFP